jgi:predicted aspartyl protease
MMRLEMKRSVLFGMVVAIAFAVPICCGAMADDRPYGQQPLVRLADNRVGLMVVVNGRGPFLFCLDTGTSKTVLTPRLLEVLGLAALPGDPVKVVTATGQLLSRYYAVNEIAAAGAVVEGERAISVDLPNNLGVWGAIGGDFLSNFIVDVDLRAQRVKLYPLSARPKVVGLERVEGRFDQHGLIIAQGKANGIPIEAVLDTGAQSSVSNVELATEVNHETVVVLEPNPRQVIDSDRRPIQAESAYFRQIQFGPTIWHDKLMAVSDLPSFGELGLASRPAILFGMDLLSNRRIVLDYNTGHVWVERRDY